MNIQSLVLDNNDFEVDMFLSIRESFRMNTTLRYLSLSNCRITDIGMCAIGTCIKYCENVRKLVLSHNKFTSKGMNALMQGFVEGAAYVTV